MEPLRTVTNVIRNRLRGHTSVLPNTKPEQQGFSDIGDTVLEGDRLLEAPVFILSSIRSGSTLLRVVLNSHSKVFSPHELHLRRIKVDITSKVATKAMSQFGLNSKNLQYLLWDRILSRELQRHNKQVLVNKTPNDVFIWRQIVQCWPNVRFIYLLRHPVAIADSWHNANPTRSRDAVEERVLQFMNAVEDARSQRDGLTVYYENLTASPEYETRRLCRYLNLEWEETMLKYGESEHGGFRRGLGDWSGRIKSGKIQKSDPLPQFSDIPSNLLNISKAWGYLSEADIQSANRSMTATWNDF